MQTLEEKGKYIAGWPFKLLGKEINMHATTIKSRVNGSHDFYSFEGEDKKMLPVEKLDEFLFHLIEEKDITEERASEIKKGLLEKVQHLPVAQSTLLKYKLKAAEQQIQQLQQVKNNYDQLCERHKILRERLQEKESSVQQLTEQVHTERAEEVNALKATIEQLERELSAVQSEGEQLRNTFTTSYQKKIAELKKQQEQEIIAAKQSVHKEYIDNQQDKETKQIRTMRGWLTAISVVCVGLTVVSCLMTFGAGKTSYGTFLGIFFSVIFILVNVVNIFIQQRGSSRQQTVSIIMVSAFALVEFYMHWQSFTHQLDSEIIRHTGFLGFTSAFLIAATNWLAIWFRRPENKELC